MIVVAPTTTATSTATKRQLVQQAFSECAINGWEYDVTPEEKDLALTRLDALMHELKALGLDLSYNFPTAIGSGSLNDQLGCPDGAFSGLGLMLAFRFAPTTRKAMSVESRLARQEAMRAIRACAAYSPPSVSLAGGTPLGAGHRYSATFQPFTSTE